MIHVIATVELHPGTRDPFLAEFRKLMPLVHAEKGCIEYGLAVDLPAGLAAQPPIRENTILVIEKWSDLHALEVHLRAPHMADYRKNVKDYVAALTLQVLQPV
jgi:quinol monooxygenase YgiN